MAVAAVVAEVAMSAAAAATRALTGNDEPDRRPLSIMAMSALRQLFLGHECTESGSLASFIGPERMAELLECLPPTLEVLSFAERDAIEKDRTLSLSFFNGPGDLLKEEAKLSGCGIIDEAGRFWPASALLHCVVAGGGGGAVKEQRRLPQLRRVAILRLSPQPTGHVPRRAHLWTRQERTVGCQVGGPAGCHVAPSCIVVMSALRRGRFGTVNHSALDCGFRRNTLFPRMRSMY